MSESRCRTGMYSNAGRPATRPRPAKPPRPPSPVRRHRFPEVSSGNRDCCRNPSPGTPYASAWPTSRCVSGTSMSAKSAHEAATARRIAPCRNAVRRIGRVGELVGGPRQDLELRPLVGERRRAPGCRLRCSWDLMQILDLRKLVGAALVVHLPADKGGAPCLCDCGKASTGRVFLSVSARMPEFACFTRLLNDWNLL